MRYNQETIIEKNITLSFEFERYLQENPRLLAQIPEDAEVVLLPKDDPELYRINLETARKAQQVGAQNLVYVEIEALAADQPAFNAASIASCYSNIAGDSQ